MADNIVPINRRLDELEQEEQIEDLIITNVTEQHARIDGVLVPVHREPIGYTEIEWGPPGRGGGRVGVRYAKYGDDGDDPGNWNQNVPKTSEG